MGMRPAPTPPAPGPQGDRGSTVADDGNHMKLRPAEAEWRRLISGPLEHIVQAMGVTQAAFQNFKVTLS